MTLKYYCFTTFYHGGDNECILFFKCLLHKLMYLTVLERSVLHVFKYKNKVCKNIRLQWQKKIKNILRISRLWEGLKKKNDVFISKLWWGMSTKYQDCPNHLHGFWRQKDMRAMHLENKNMVRTFLDLEMKKTKNIRRLPSVLMFL